MGWVGALADFLFFRIIRGFWTGSLIVRLISHQPAVLFSQNKSTTSNQPTVLFSQNKSAPAISHQPNEGGDEGRGQR
jgi:hypothetical protein